MRTIDRQIARHCFGIALASLALAGLVAGPAMGASSEERQGAQLLGSLQAGKATCTSLTTDNFERIGEYVMGRMLGSSAAHDAMNRQITLMMGGRGETQAHTFMGQRFAGCDTGRAPASFGAMMGMMGAGMMGSAYSGGTSSMMGSTARGTGGMMGYGSATSSASRSDRWTSGDTVMVVLMGLLLALAIGTLAAWRPWRRSATPLETLQARYAHGEIDEQDFDRRRQALGGTA